MKVLLLEELLIEVDLLSELLGLAEGVDVGVDVDMALDSTSTTGWHSLASTAGSTRYA